MITIIVVISKQEEKLNNTSKKKINRMKPNILVFLTPFLGPSR